MEQLKTFALMLVFCAAAGLIYYLLLPSGRISETAKGVFSALMLLCVLTPLFSFFGMETPAFSLPQESGISETASLTLLESVKERLRLSAEQTVRRFTGLPCRIEIDAHITADYGIDIKGMRLIFPEDFQERPALEAALREAFGFAPTVEIREDE